MLDPNDYKRETPNSAYVSAIVDNDMTLSDVETLDMLDAKDMNMVTPYERIYSDDYGGDYDY